MVRTRDAEAELKMPPGFRFHPTDEELVVYYLCRKATQQRLPVSIIAEVDLYKHDPWQLPDRALFGNKEWYFFTPRDRKYPNGSRPNRAAGCGYWKATGANKPITPAGSTRPLGTKKALVFYAGRAPRGVKTNWIMHEYRLVDANNKDGGPRLDEWVLCRLYNKKKEWQRMQVRQTGKAPVCEPMDSLEATEATASEGLGMPDSDVDNDVYTEQDRPLAFVPRALDAAQAPSRTSATAAAAQFAERFREDDGSFIDLSLDDLQSSLMAFQGAPNSLDLSCQDYHLSCLTSPPVKPYQANNFPTFGGANKDVEPSPSLMWWTKAQGTMLGSESGSSQ